MCVSMRYSVVPLCAYTRDVSPVFGGGIVSVDVLAASVTRVRAAAMASRRRRAASRTAHVRPAQNSHGADMYSVHRTRDMGISKVSARVDRVGRSPCPPTRTDRTATLQPRDGVPREHDDGRRATSADRDRESSRRSTPSCRSIDDPDRYEQIGEHARGGLGRVVRAVDKPARPHRRGQGAAAPRRRGTRRGSCARR